MDRFFSFLLSLVCCMTLSATDPGGGGGRTAPNDTCIAVSLTGECYSFIDGAQPQRVSHKLKASQSTAKAPHFVDLITCDKLLYSIFDFDDGNGCVATLVGWADSYTSRFFKW